MEMVKVESGNIEEIGYEVDTFEPEINTPSLGTMDIKFKGGGLYRYKKVPDITYFKFKESTSLGKYFHAEIRDKYKTFKVVLEENVSGEMTETEVEVPLKEPKK